MTFVAAAAADQAPAEGELVRTVINDIAVAVANVGGTLYAFADSCTHAKCSLSDGELEDGEVICVCHNGAFNVATGEVTAPPPTEPLPTYRVRLAGDHLQIDV